MTKDYQELVKKAGLFAQFCEYDWFTRKGHFEFYNSPIFRSFNFDVDPDTFHNANVELYIISMFERRFNYG